MVDTTQTALPRPAGFSQCAQINVVFKEPPPDSQCLASSHYFMQTLSFFKATFPCDMFIFSGPYKREECRMSYTNNCASFLGVFGEAKSSSPISAPLFLHHCKAKETSSKLSCPCTGGFSCWLTRGSGELGLLWVLLSLWRGVIWMMFVVPFSSTSFWFGPRAHFQIFCMALACVCECGDSTGFVSSSFNLPVPLHLRSPGLRRGLSELCSPSLAQVTCFSQQIQTVWSKDNKVVSSCQLLQFFLPS